MSKTYCISPHKHAGDKGCTEHTKDFFLETRGSISEPFILYSEKGSNNHSELLETLNKNDEVLIKSIAELTPSLADSIRLCLAMLEKGAKVFVYDGEFGELSKHKEFLEKLLDYSVKSGIKFYDKTFKPL